MKSIFTYLSIIFIFGVIGLLSLDIIILPIITNYNKTIYLPDYRNIDYRIAQKKLDSLGFEYKIIMTNYNELYTPYSIIEMSPRPFTKVKTGRIITLD